MSSTVVKREFKIVQPQGVISGDILCRGYVFKVDGDATYRYYADEFKVIGRPWAQGSETWATVLNVFGENEVLCISNYEYGEVKVRRCV